MKKMKFVLMVFTAMLVSVQYSCKKNGNEEEKPKVEDVKLDSNVSQFNDDSNNYKNESDQVSNEINTSLKDDGYFGRKAGINNSMCGVTVDTTYLANKKVIFKFDGVTPCFSPSRTRSGEITAELVKGNKWADVGAVLKLTFTNFKITRLYDNKSVMINGVKTMYNINGNNWFGFLTGISTLKYKERALNINVTFSGGTNATWNSARVTEYSYNPATKIITFTANGDTTINSIANMDSWGVNRFAQNFSTYYKSPWTSNTTCDYWRPIKGEFVHNVNSTDFTFTLGVDQQGNPSTLQCAYGFKVSWVAQGKTNTVILTY